jgi:ATP-binding cassette subfamily F protein 3
MALNEFEGTVLLVSHDRALLREVCDEFWLVTRGGVLPFDGDLDDYQKWLLDVSRATARGQTPPEPPKPAVAERAAAPAPPAPAKAPRPAVAANPVKASAPAAPAASRADRQQDKQAKARLADATRPLRNEVLRIDARLAKLAAEKAEVEALLSAPQRSGDDFAELGRRLSHVAAETAQLEERWLVLHSELEAMGAAG